MRIVLASARYTRRADIDVVTAGGEVDTGFRPQGDVRGASCVVRERLKPLGRVVVDRSCC